MKFADVLALLAAHKGDGSWREISTRAGVHYETIARVARGDMPSPSVLIVERIAAALEAMFPAEVTK